MTEEINNKILNKFIEEEMSKANIGSGDDEYYASQIKEYINKQRGLWLSLIKQFEEKIQQLKK